MSVEKIRWRNWKFNCELSISADAIENCSQTFKTQIQKAFNLQWIYLGPTLRFTTAGSTVDANASGVWVGRLKDCNMAVPVAYLNSEHTIVSLHSVGWDTVVGRGAGPDRGIEGSCQSKPVHAHLIEILTFTSVQFITGTHWVSYLSKYLHIKQVVLLQPTVTIANSDFSRS